MEQVVEMKDLVFSYEPNVRLNLRKKFQKKMKEIQKIGNEVNALEENLLAIRLKAIKKADPIVAEMRQARLASLSNLDQAFRAQFFNKNEKNQIRELILHGAREGLMIGAEEAQIYIDKYEVQESKFSLKGIFKKATREFKEEYLSESSGTDDTEKKAEETEKKFVPNASSEVKALYRTLAKSFHPDTEMDESLKQIKNDLMQRVARAYEDGNLFELLKIESEHLGKLTATEDNLKEYMESLDNQLRDLKRKRNELKDDGPLAVIYKKYYSKNVDEIERRINLETDVMQNDLFREQAFVDLFANHTRLREYLRQQENILDPFEDLSEEEHELVDELIEDFLIEMKRDLKHRGRSKKR